MKLKKNDTVMIIAGKNRSRQGKIEKVLPKSAMVVVTGININKHHLKPSRQNPHGGIIDKPAPIRASNAILICPRCGKPARIGHKFIKNEQGQKKIRICRVCQESVD